MNEMKTALKKIDTWYEKGYITATERKELIAQTEQFYIADDEGC